MTDIVERLRKPSGIGEPMDHMAMEEAADEIEQLRDRASLMRATAVPRDEVELLRNDLEENEVIATALTRIVASQRAEIEKMRAEWQAEMVSDQFKIGKRDEEIERLRAEIERLTCCASS